MLKTQEITLFGILNCSIIVAQVRERTLLRKEDYACSEVIPAHGLSPNLRTPTIPSKPACSAGW